MYALSAQEARAVRLFGVSPKEGGAVGGFGGTRGLGAAGRLELEKAKDTRGLGGRKETWEPREGKRPHGDLRRPRRDTRKTAHRFAVASQGLEASAQPFLLKFCGDGFLCL